MLQPMKTAPRQGQVLLVRQFRDGTPMFSIGTWQEYKENGFWVVSDFGPDLQDQDFLGWLPLPEIEI